MGDVLNKCLVGAAAAAALGAALTVATPASAGLIGGAINKAIASHGDGPVYFEHGESFRGLRKAVLGQFTIVILTKKVDYAGGGFLSTNGRAKAIGQLTGLCAADGVRIADAIYADFLAKAAKAGLEFVDPAAYYASKYYGAVRSADQGQAIQAPLRDDDKASGVAYWPSSMAHRDSMAISLGALDGRMRDVYTAQYAYAKDTKTPVLNVVYVIDFDEPATTSGGGVFQTVKVTSELAVSNRGSAVMVMDTDGKTGKIMLNKPLVEAGGFAQISDVTSGFTKGAESAQTLMNVGGALLGGGSHAFGKSSLQRTFDFHITDPGNYATLVQQAASTASDLFLDQIRGVR